MQTTAQEGKNQRSRKAKTDDAGRKNAVKRGNRHSEQAPSRKKTSVFLPNNLAKERLSSNKPRMFHVKHSRLLSKTPQSRALCVRIVADLLWAAEKWQGRTYPWGVIRAHQRRTIRIRQQGLLRTHRQRAVRIRQQGVFGTFCKEWSKRTSKERSERASKKCFECTSKGWFGAPTNGAWGAPTRQCSGGAGQSLCSEHLKTRVLPVFSLFHVKRSGFYVMCDDVLPNNRFFDRRAFSRKVFIETAYANCLRKLFVQLIGVQPLGKYLALFLPPDVLWNMRAKCASVTFMRAFLW